MKIKCENRKSLQMKNMIIQHGATVLLSFCSHSTVKKNTVGWQSDWRVQLRGVKSWIVSSFHCYRVHSTVICVYVKKMVYTLHSTAVFLRFHFIGYHLSGYHQVPPKLKIFISLIWSDYNARIIHLRVSYIILITSISAPTELWRKSIPLRGLDGGARLNRY